MKLNKNYALQAVPVEEAYEERRFGRWQDVQRVYGLKRGTIYNLLKLGKIKGVAVRVTQKRSRVRLIDMSSVDAFLAREIAAQSKPAKGMTSK
jgi:hypothetical protein